MRRKNTEVSGKIGQENSSSLPIGNSHRQDDANADVPPHHPVAQYGRRAQVVHDDETEKLRVAKALSYQNAIREQMEEKRRRVEIEKARIMDEDSRYETKARRGADRTSSASANVPPVFEEADVSIVREPAQPQSGRGVVEGDPRQAQAKAYQKAIREQMEEKRQRIESEKARIKAEDLALEKKILQSLVPAVPDVKLAAKEGPQGTARELSVVTQQVPQPVSIPESTAQPSHTEQVQRHVDDQAAATSLPPFLVDFPKEQYQQQTGPQQADPYQREHHRRDEDGITGDVVGATATPWLGYMVSEPMQGYAGNAVASAAVVDEDVELDCESALVLLQ